MKAIILAAGFGTRLYPLTENTAKPLIKINEIPIIDLIIEKLIKIENLEKIYLIVNNKFYMDFLEWKYNSNHTSKITIINNNIDDPLNSIGAIGDLKNALKYINLSDTLILAGDSIFDFNLNNLIELSNEKNSSTIALKIIKNIELVKKYSCVELNNQNQIINFKEKPKKPKTNIVSTAFYFLKLNDLNKIINHEFENNDNLGSLIEFLHKNSKIHGHTFDDFWIDIGSFEELKRIKDLKPKPL
jgi:glucose-1-phosphate thymidylyltransferase